MQEMPNGALHFDAPDKRSLTLTPNGKGLDGIVRLAAYYEGKLVKRHEGVFRNAKVRRDFAILCQRGVNEGTTVADGLRWEAFFDQAEDLMPAKVVVRVELPPVETGADLQRASIAPLRHCFTGLLHEGLTIFGGKSKRGKSFLAQQIASEYALGRKGIGHFPCHERGNVLYLALEDGRRRLQGRLDALYPDKPEALNNLHMRYSFPRLAEGGVEALIAEIQKHQYSLVFIDVLAKLESPGRNGSKSYLEAYDMLAPLQELRNKHQLTIVMLTHLRKSEAEDVFDALMGSTGYAAAQDVLWVLERKPQDDHAMLYIKDKDAEDQTIALRFTGSKWEYQGEGEEYQGSKDQQRIIRVLVEEAREMSIREIMQACGMPEKVYDATRQTLVRLVEEDMIHRTKRGAYSATMRGKVEMTCSGSDDDSSMPF